jgi:hypothetical protein
MSSRLDCRPDGRQRAPHRPRNRIASIRAVQNDAREWRLEAQGYIGHEALRTPDGDGWKRYEQFNSNIWPID